MNPNDFESFLQGIQDENPIDLDKQSTLSEGAQKVRDELLAAFNESDEKAEVNDTKVVPSDQDTFSMEGFFDDSEATEENTPSNNPLRFW